MANDPKVIPFGDSTRPGSNSAYDRHPIIGSLQSLVTKQLQHRVHSMFDSADDALFEMADKAETNTIQSMYFDSMRLVRIQRNEIETSFTENIAEAFHSFLLTNSQVNDSGLHAAFSLEELSLVDETDMEEDLAVTGLVGKVKNRLAQDLFAIEQRLAEVMPNITVDEDNNPFGPKRICEAFRSALQKLDGELKIKLIIYKLFDKHVISRLGEVYADVNNRFVAAGVLPHLKMTVKKMPGSARPSSGDEPASASDLELPGMTSSAGGYAEGDGVMHSLQQLLAAARGHGGTATGPGVGGPSDGFVADATMGSGVGGGVAPAGFMPGGASTAGTVQLATSDTVAALTNLQTSGVALTGGLGQQVDATQLKTVLLEEHQRVAGVAGGQHINPMDNDIIDVVSMMFDFILEDDNLPIAAKALIGRLQIPMVKVAILDKEFFSNRVHPARVLLNDLAQAGIGIDESEQIEDSERYATLAHIVERVLSDFTDNLAIFTELQSELAAMLATEADKEKRAEQAAVQEGWQREQVQLAKTWVAEVIREHLHGKVVPQVVIDIIKGPWKDVLLDTYLNEGQDSRLWKEQLRFVDILVWSVEPKQTAMERQKLAGVILQLLDTFRHGLESINYSEEEMQDTVKLLEPIHLASFRGKLAPQPDEFTTEPSTESEQEVSNDPKTLEIELDEVQGVLDQATAALEASLEDHDEELSSNPVSEEFAYTEVDGDVIEDIILSGFDALDPAADEDMPDDEYLNLARMLEAGKWVEFTDDQGNARRAKLAWKSELLNECTFLDWKYKVVADTTIHGFAADLRRGTAKVIDDVPLFERAMDAVVSGLRTKQANA